MQASAMWLIFTAQLCRAIAAWLTPQKKLSFMFFSPASHHLVSALLLNLVFTAVPLASRLLIAVLERHYCNNYANCNQMDDLTAVTKMMFVL